MYIYLNKGFFVILVFDYYIFRILILKCLCVLCWCKLNDFNNLVRFKCKVLNEIYFYKDDWFDGVLLSRGRYNFLYCSLIDI